MGDQDELGAPRGVVTAGCQSVHLFAYKALPFGVEVHRGLVQDRDTALRPAKGLGDNECLRNPAARRH
jgi:hypothetical protein